MIRTFRRCPTSLPRLLLSANKTLSSARTHIRLENPYLSPKPLCWNLSGAFHDDCTLRQYGAAARTREREVEDEVRPGRPTSDAQIKNVADVGTLTRFQELSDHGLVHDNVVKVLTQEMGLETMTQVQSMTISEALKGTDILAQAKTGTGKTIGFLLPVLQNILKVDPSLAFFRPRHNRGDRASAADIRALIISPTRELAEQIAEEARKLVKNTSVIVQTAVGGTRKAYGLQMIQQQGCHILVGTPGRLKDIFSDTSTGVKAPSLSALVLDEADRLLDAGFWPEIQIIQSHLPDSRVRERQTLMFSATVPQEVVALVRKTMRPNFQHVQTVQDDELPTHERVPQRLVNAGKMENLLPALYELIRREIAASQNNLNSSGETRPFKAIIYFNSTAEVTVAASTFQNLKQSLHPVRIYDIHSKLTQMQRTHASDAFRRAQSALLLSSDVTARGMDFPRVTHVIQVGLPSSRDQYVHRLGRTARAGQEGEGWLLVSDMSMRETAERLHGLPLAHDDSLQAAKLDMQALQYGSDEAYRQAGEVGAQVKQLMDAMENVPRTEKVKAYLSQLGTYGWYGRKQRLIDAMNDFARYGMRMESVPSIGPALVQRLGLGGLSGLNVQRGGSREDYEDEGGRGGRSYSRDSSGGSERRAPWEARGDKPQMPWQGRGYKGSKGSIGAKHMADRRDGERRASAGGYGGRTSSGYGRSGSDTDTRGERSGSGYGRSGSGSDMESRAGRSSSGYGRSGGDTDSRGGRSSSGYGGGRSGASGDRTTSRSYAR